MMVVEIIVYSLQFTVYCLRLRKKEVDIRLSTSFCFYQELENFSAISARVLCELNYALCIMNYALFLALVRSIITSVSSTTRSWVRVWSWVWSRVRRRRWSIAAVAWSITTAVRSRSIATI